MLSLLAKKQSRMFFILLAFCIFYIVLAPLPNYIHAYVFYLKTFQSLFKKLFKMLLEMVKKAGCPWLAITRELFHLRH